jgi:hypothetical protein
MLFFNSRSNGKKTTTAQSSAAKNNVDIDDITISADGIVRLNLKNDSTQQKVWGVIKDFKKIKTE